MTDIQYPQTPVDERSIAGNPVSTGIGNTDLGTQRVVLPSDQPAIPVTSAPNFGTRQDTFVAVGSGNTVNKSTAPIARFGLQIKGTGAAATAWDVVLEGSLDGINFSTILEHTSLVGDGQIMWSGPLDSPCLYFRSRVVSLTLGSATNIVATILGMN
jgi:hypothetical protein